MIVYFKPGFHNSRQEKPSLSLQLRRLPCGQVLLRVDVSLNVEPVAMDRNVTSELL